MPLPLIGLGIGLAGTIGKMISRGKANKELGKLSKQDPKYQINQIARDRLALAKTMLNARMPGAIQVEKNILGNQANRLGSINKLATDSATALSMANQVSNKTDQQLSDLGTTEAGDYYRRLGFLNEAQEGMISEEDKSYEDTIRRYGNLLQIKGAQASNRSNTWGDIAGLGFGLADFASSGGGNMFGGKSKSYDMIGGSGTTPQGYGNLVNRSLFNKPRMRIN
jgi:hypothetical protein